MLRRSRVAGGEVRVVLCPRLARGRERAWPGRSDAASLRALVYRVAIEKSPVVLVCTGGGGRAGLCREPRAGTVHARRGAHFALRRSRFSCSPRLQTKAGSQTPAGPPGQSGRTALCRKWPLLTRGRATSLSHGPARPRPPGSSACPRPSRCPCSLPFSGAAAEQGQALPAGFVGYPKQVRVTQGAELASRCLDHA